MKTKHGLLFGFAVIAIAAMFTLAGCDDGSKDDGGGGSITIGNLPNGNLGTTFTISDEQVYVATYNQGIPAYTEATGNNTVTISGATGTASIANGKLTVSITAAPTGLSAISGLTNVDAYPYPYASITASDTTAKFTTLELKAGSNDYLSYGNDSFSVSGSNASSTQESVQYVYVDKDVTLTGTGKSTTEDGGTINTNNFTLDLKTGWNAIYSKTSISGTMTSYTGTVSMAVGNPTNLKWYYYNY